jgi:hypothetical protein
MASADIYKNCISEKKERTVFNGNGIAGNERDYRPRNTDIILRRGNCYSKARLRRDIKRSCQ